LHRPPPAGARYVDPALVRHAPVVFTAAPKTRVEAKTIKVP
jgi:hypothetical protein